MPYISEAMKDVKSGEKSRKADKAERMRTKQEKELKERLEKEESQTMEQLEPSEMKKKGYTIMTSDADEIACGPFSSIYRAKYRDKDIAVRIIEKEGKDNELLYKFLPRMVKILKVLDTHHANIISTLDIYETSKRVLILMELVSLGNMKEYLRSDNELLPEDKVKKFAKDIASGLCYLHVNGLAHRNLKSENILISDDFTAKISGFIYSRLWMDPVNNKNILSDTFTKIGHPYCPPEHLSGDKYDPRASDVWSFAVILFNILNKKYPFNYNQLHVLVGDQRKEQWKSRLRPDASDGVKHLFMKCFKLNFRERITIIHILSHPWMECTTIVKPEESEHHDIVEEDADSNVIRADILKEMKMALKQLQ